MDNEQFLEIIREMQRDVQNIDKTLIRNTVSLEEHIRRTEILEEKLDPIEKHVTKVQGALKLILSSSVLLGLFQLLSKLF